MIQQAVRSIRHCLDMVGVGGSNPLAPTNKSTTYNDPAKGPGKSTAIRWQYPVVCLALFVTACTPVTPDPYWPQIGFIIMTLACIANAHESFKEIPTAFNAGFLYGTAEWRNETAPDWTHPSRWPGSEWEEGKRAALKSKWPRERSGF